MRLWIRWNGRDDCACDHDNKEDCQANSSPRTVQHCRLPVEHRGSAAKAAFNDCPRARKAKGALLAVFVSCIRLLASILAFPKAQP